MIDHTSDARTSRKYQRYIFSEPINVTRLHPATVIPSIALEISEGGMSAIAPEEFRVGEETELLLNIPRGRLIVHAVVRNKNQFRYGFEFIDVTEEQRALIRNLCDSSPPYNGGIDQE